MFSLKVLSRCGLLAIAVVHFAGMAAQLFDGRGAQAGVGEGVDEHIQQGNKLGVVEGLLVVVAEPVLKLDFSETQQSGFRVGGRVVHRFWAEEGGWWQLPWRPAKAAVLRREGAA